MKILHYFLGFPPYRTGGMTKFAFDLMKKQVEDLNDVYSFWPGTLINVSGKPKIKKINDIEGIKNFELINPLPVPLDEGINDYKAFINSCDIKIYIKFLKNISPDIIHIHTLMGLHREFIEAANIIGIKVIFTTHDFFGICPKVTLLKNGKSCINDNDCSDCVECNLNALSLTKIKLLQSPMYRYFKNTPLLKKVRGRHRNKFHNQVIDTKINKTNIDSVKATEYKKLREYYISMIQMMDYLHFNSSLTKDIYLKYVKPKDCGVITITHSNINNDKIIKKIKLELNKKKVYTFLSPTKPYKGFDVLVKALDEIWIDDKNFELRVYAPVQKVSPYIKVKEDGFLQSDLKKIMSESDILFAPSNAYETFGFTVLEALSYGVPVIISDNVGAKDIIGDAGKIFNTGDYKDLKNTILSVDEKKLKALTENAFELKVKLWDDFVNEIYSIYKKV